MTATIVVAKETGGWCVGNLEHIGITSTALDRFIESARHYEDCGEADYAAYRLELDGDHDLYVKINQKILRNPGARKIEISEHAYRDFAIHVMVNDVVAVRIISQNINNLFRILASSGTWISGENILYRDSCQIPF